MNLTLKIKVDSYSVLLLFLNEAFNLTIKDLLRKVLKFEGWKFRSEKHEHLRKIITAHFI